jgi:hypothetical protein
VESPAKPPTTECCRGRAGCFLGCVPFCVLSFGRWATDPARLARNCLADLWTFNGDYSLRHWRDQFYEWDGIAYHLIGTGDVRARVTNRIQEEVDRLAAEGVGDRNHHRLAVTTGLLTNVMQCKRRLNSVAQVG